MTEFARRPGLGPRRRPEQEPVRLVAGWSPWDSRDHRSDRLVAALDPNLEETPWHSS